MTTEILLVLTSHRQLGETDQETGVWLEEAVNPYYRFLEAGFEVTLASPNGGDVPIDDKSILDEAQTEDTRHFSKMKPPKNALTIPFL